MGLLSKLSRSALRLVGGKRLDDPHASTLGLHICRYEEMESRALMAADLHVGGVYFEDASGDDASPDIIQVTFEGGQPGTQLNRVVIDTDKDGKGLSDGDLFFDTAAGGLGSFGNSPLKIVSHDGFQVVGATVSDGGTKLTFDLTGWDPGEKLVFSIDVDEAQYIDPETGAIDTNALVEGGEFQRSKLTATFAAPHFHDVTGTAVFFDAFDVKFAELDAAAGNHLNLPNDAYSAADQSFIDRTAGGATTLNQVPLPITIAGTVFDDLNINNRQDAGDNGIPGVSLALLKFNGAEYVATGLTTTTNAQGHYKFTEGILPGKYRVVEAQPAGYFSVGAQAGSVDGVTDGLVLTSDIITDIKLLGGDDSIRNDFAEARPASIRGRVHVDNNDNCVQDPGEAGIAGVTIKLLDAQGNVVGVTTTDANGDYVFDNLAPGVYGIREEQPAGYYDSAEMPGSAGGIVSANDVITSISLGSGVNAVHYDFCELLPASISGRVHVDNNDNCLQDAGEPGIAGVKVHLLDSAGKTIATTLTDANGDYKFENLAPGTYGVYEEQPAGYFDSGEMEGSAGGTVSANDTITGVVLGSGVHAVDYNFCELLPASISGRVHVDLDGDCMEDEGEPPIAGVTIKLLDANGQVIATTLTDANGDYKFENLKPGTYGVLEEQPAGYFDSGEMPGSAGGTVSANDKITGAVLGSGVHAVDYNFCEMLPASISGHVYADMDGDCMYDEGEPDLAGVVIHLLDANGNVIGTTSTDAHGNYKFENLAPGTYGVREEQPAGYYDSGEMAGSEGGVVSDDKITGVVLGSGVAAVHYDFCEMLPASISGHVYADLDDDCMEDEGEPALEGVTIQLLDVNGNVIATTLTDANGDYKFDNLAPGTYGVREIQPAGYFDSGEMAGSVGGEVADDLITKIALGSGVNATNYDFCELLPASIAGHVYADLDGDCEYDPGEPSIAGVTIHLLDANGNVIGTTLTDADGNYKFENLAPGTYGVREIQPDGYYDSGEMAGSAGGEVADDLITKITLGSGVAAVHYDFCELLPASIKGHVHVDNNDDCMQQEDEPNLAGVKILLLDGEGNLLDTTFTDANGDYEFTDLAPGNYRVQEVQPLDYFDGGDSVGSVGGNNEINDLLTDILLEAGVNATGYDFCELPPGSISGYVFQDGPPIQADSGAPINVADYRDGLLTPDDIRLSGVTLELRDGVTGQPILGSHALSGTYDPTKPIRVTTNANGYFEFINLPKGNYAVFEVQPDGYIDGIDTPGSTGGIAVNPSDSLPQAILEELSVPHNGDAILRITLFAGDHSVENNFSEVVTEQFFFFQETPPPAPQIFNPVIDIKTPDNPFIPATSPLLVAQSYFSGSSPVLNYTWHLSVVNAGQPRAMQDNETTVALVASAEDVAAWRDALTAGSWDLSTTDTARSKAASRLAFGIRHGTPITGDFNGDGVTDLGVFLDGQWFIDVNGNGQWDEGDLWAKLGKRGDKPVTGDWDNDGKTDIGIYGPAWPGDPRAIAAEPGIPDPHNKNTKVAKNVPPPPHLAAFGVRSLKKTAHGKVRADLIDHVFHYGTPQDIPVVGDWNGDGTDTIAVFRDGWWYRDLDGDGKWSEGDLKEKFGESGDIPIVGDFNGDGIPEMGVYRDGVWYIDTNGNHKADDGDTVIKMGGPGDKPVVGDWDGDGKSDPGVYREGDEAPCEARKR